MTQNRPSDFIPTQTQEAVKAHFEYDSLNRLSKSYSANFYAQNGEPCLVTEYQYVGSSTRVANMKEHEGVWNSAWDF